MIRSIGVSVLLLLLSAFPLAAQRSLTLAEAFRRADSAAFANRIAAGDARATGAQATAALQGILPTVRAVAGYVRSNDPVVNARIDEIRKAGGNPFYDYQIPQAAIALKQGFGRLIRSRSDRGVLVMLDNRITKQRYGQVFFDSLPDYGFTTKLADVEKFFNV